MVLPMNPTTCRLMKDWAQHWCWCYIQDLWATFTCQSNCKHELTHQLNNNIKLVPHFYYPIQTSLYWCIPPTNHNYQPPIHPHTITTTAQKQVTQKPRECRQHQIDTTTNLSPLENNPRLFTKMISQHVQWVQQITLKECLYSFNGIIDFWNLVLQLVPLFRIQGDTYKKFKTDH